MDPTKKGQGLASDNIATATSTTDQSSTGAWPPGPSSADQAQSSSDDSNQSVWDDSVPALPSVPSVSLPKGGGALRGMGDKFSTSSATGTCSLSIPISTSPGRNGFGANLSLSYDSSAPNGPFGLGWVLSVPSISRKTDKGIPQYRDPAGPGSDTFILTGSEDLVPELAPGADSSTEWTRPAPAVKTSDGIQYNVYAYRPRVEGSFIRIELWANIEAPNTDIHWRSTSPTNVLSIYGLTSNSRVVDPEDPTRIFRWLLCQQIDRGNALAIEYKAEDSANIPATLNERNRTDLSRSSHRYVKNVFYGNFVSTLVQADLSKAQWHFQVVFDYGEHDAQTPKPAEVNPWLCRKDPFSTNRSGFEVRSYRLCQRVLMFHNFPNEPTAGVDCLVRSTNFMYQDDAQTGNENMSFLASISGTGYQRAGNLYQSTSLPPLEFTYSNATIDFKVHELDQTSLENLPVGLDQSSYKWVDLDGEGLSGFLTGMAGAWYYKHNMGGGKFGPLQCLSSTPSLAQIQPGTTQHLMDLTGDGRLDVVEFRPGGIQGFSKRSFDNGWEPFLPFLHLPSIDWQNSNLQLLDVTGDGLSDALVIEPDCLRTFEFLGVFGFMDERRWYPPDQLDDEKGPLLIYADQKHTVFLTDMTGDGLQDLVRIRNGEVCYWAGQGYGRFSPKVTMLQSPWFESPDIFDPVRVRIGDVDGSGTNDIVYLTADGFVDIYLNYSGNTFSPRTRLQAFPPVDNLATVTIVDLLGKGTGCLVWSSSLPGDISRRISYIDLIEGIKPNLLTSYINNMGAETRLSYAPSSKFYIQDKEAGHPWFTHLPFPTQVVERVEKFDYIANTYFSTRYSYHHGYFDGVEREFRGFGRVDQLDTEEYNIAGPPPSNVDQASWIPPVLTKTWFHTGAYIKERQVSEFFESEYYVEPGILNVADAAAMLLPGSVLPSSLSGSPYAMTYPEASESVRSLKGSMLRQEIYALDGSAQEPEPYLITHKNFTVQILQPQQPNRYAVFLSTPRESVQYHYDRNFVSVGSQQVADPRVAHTLNLAIDQFGNILQSLSVAYGRRHADNNPQLTITDTTKQQQTSCTLAVKAYTNAVETTDAYRTPALCETQSFEVINLPTTPNLTFTQLVRFSNVFATIETLLPGTFDIPFEDWTNSTAVAGQPSRRLLNHKRIIYRKDDFTGPLSLGQQQSQALPYDSFLQILTPGLVQSVYVNSGKLSTADMESTLSSVCNLVHSEGDTNWWIRAGNVFLSPDSTDTPAQESAYAAEHFYLLRRFRDANYSATFDTETFVTMDEYDLLVIESRDPFGNRVTAGARDTTNATIVTPGGDYRVLAPALVMDPNRNRIAVAFDDLGRMIARAVMGKPEETLGDNLSAVNLRPSDADTQAYFSDPLANPAAIIGTATSKVVYDTSAYYNSKSTATPQPVRMAILNREIAVSDLAAGSQSPIRHLLSYNNGSGTQIQGIAQGDADPTMVTPRWIVSGWTIFDNKGHAIQKYEPFFSATPQYQPNAIVGVSSLMMYDAVGRVVATLNPNHSWSKTIYRAWSQETWDANDTVLISDPATDPDIGGHFSRIPSPDYLPSWHDARITGALGPQQQSAALKTAIHAGTPSLGFFDPLGRTIVAVVEKKYQRSTEATVTDVFLSSRTVFDVSGNIRQRLDANGRLVQTQDADMLGHTIHTANMESGEGWGLKSVTLQDASIWNSRGFRSDTSYDQIRRPTQVHLTQNGGPPSVTAQTVYGESQLNPEASNLRTKAYSVSDQSGYKIQTEFDYKGNLLNSTRAVVSAYDSVIDWAAMSNPMEPQTYHGSTTYDALNRVVLTTNPDGSIVKNTYGVCGLIQNIDLNLQGSATGWQSILSSAIYNAKGQRLLATTNNSVQSVYTYDPLTFQLTDLVTSRSASAFPGDCPQPPLTGWPGCQIQSLHYTFDPIGNITNIVDDAQQTIFFQNQRVEPSQAFTYDSVYQLIEATGREHLGQLGTPSPYGPSTVSDNWLQGPSDGNAMGTYNEQYFFDNVGNLHSMKHSGSDPTQPGWTRTYNYAEKSLLEPASKFNNQLSSTSIGGVTDQYSYTGNAGLTGNMTSMPHLSLMQYDFRDQLQATATQRVNSGTPVTTWYSYDTGGKRVRKLTVNAAAAGAKPIPKAERIYLGPFEVYREFAVDGTTVTRQRETLSIMNGPQRIALIETRSIGTDKYPAQQIRFQYTNHIGSASLELDDQAQILTYEEFYPFGSSSYQATGSQSEVPKRYRYTGKELDGENGFYYHGARYCAPWLGRWINCDPGGTDTSGPNLYAYANGNPVIYNDPSGMEAKKHKHSPPSTHSKPDKKAAPAAPPPGPSKLDVLIDELIAILKKDIADNNKALAEAKAAIAKNAEAPKEAPDNPPALTTTTTTNGSQAMFPVEPSNKRATDIGGKTTLDFAAPTQKGAEGFFNANVTGEFHQYVPLPSPKLVLSFGSLISGTAGTPKDQSQFSVQGQAFFGGVLWNSKAAPGESPKAGAGGGAYFSLGAGSQGTSVNGTLAVDIGYKDPTNHFSNAVLNINGTKYVSGSGTSSLGVVAGAQLQYGPWGVLPEVGFTHNFDADGSWSPLAAVAFSGTGPDHGHTSVWSLEVGVTANVAEGHLQSVGGFATLGYGFRLADKPVDKK